MTDRERPCCTALLSAVLALAACGFPTAEDREENVCQQTGEFGNYGCAELVVVPGDVPEDAPADYRWSVQAEGENARFEFVEHGEDPIPPEIEGRTILWMNLPEGVDTTTVPVVAEIRADTADPAPVGEPLPLFAVDSVDHTFRFAEVGERPRPDTIRFNLDRVGSE